MFFADFVGRLVIVRVGCIVLWWVSSMCTYFNCTVHCYMCKLYHVSHDRRLSVGRLSSYIIDVLQKYKRLLI